MMVTLTGTAIGLYWECFGPGAMATTGYWLVEDQP